MGRYTNLMGWGELDAAQALEQAQAAVKRAKQSMADAVGGFDALDAAGEYLAARHLASRLKELTDLLDYASTRNGDPALTVALYHDELLVRVLGGPQDGWSGNGLRNVGERMRASIDRDIITWLESVRVNDRSLGRAGYQALARAYREAKAQAEREARQEREARLNEDLGTVRNAQGKTVKTSGVSARAKKVVEGLYGDAFFKVEADRVWGTQHGPEYAVEGMEYPGGRAGARVLFIASEDYEYHNYTTGENDIRDNSDNRGKCIAAAAELERNLTEAGYKVIVTVRNGDENEYVEHPSGRLESVAVALHVTGWAQ